MQLNIEMREKDGACLLDLTGRITLGEECSSLREAVKKLLAEKKETILLNLKSVERVDSCGIGILVELVILSAKQGTHLRLYSVPSRVYNSLVIHRLVQAFDIFDTEEAALSGTRAATA